MRKNDSEKYRLGRFLETDHNDNNLKILVKNSYRLNVDFSKEKITMRGRYKIWECLGFYEKTQKRLL